MSTLRRLLGYKRPYLARLVVASTMLVISGALMGLVISTVKPLLNDVLLGQRTGSADTGAGRAPGADILETLRGWIPQEPIADWWPYLTKACQAIRTQELQGEAVGHIVKDPSSMAGILAKLKGGA